MQLIDHLLLLDPAQPRAALVRAVRRRDALALCERCNLPRATARAWAACADAPTAHRFLTAYLASVGIARPTPPSH